MRIEVARCGRAGVALLACLLATACAGVPLPRHTRDEQASIDQAQLALDRMGGLSAGFVQDGPGGDGGAGRVWFEPGHLRLQYDRPTRRLAVAGDGRLVVHDDATDATTRIALSANPLGLLLSGRVRLSGDVDVTDVQRSARVLQLSLARTDNPAQGLLTLFFAVQPGGDVLLSGLEAVDAHAHRTRFTLFDQQPGQSFAPSLFHDASVTTR